jgi:5-methylcytosine-specific restriction endonuclease McrA
VRPATHVDHLVARSQGGSDSPANLVASCASCNLKRGAAGGVPARTDPA